MYQLWLNTDDADVVIRLKVFMLLPTRAGSKEPKCASRLSPSL